MKKSLKKALIIIIANILLSTHLPILVFAEYLNDKTITEDNNTEVIIMYKQNTKQSETKKRNSNVPNFLQDFTVENSISFDDIEGNLTKTKSTKAATNTDNMNTNLVVSLVKSDKYSDDELIKKLSLEESVMYVQKNYKVKPMTITNDEYQKHQWAIENIGQNNGTSGLDINPEAINNQSLEEKVIVVLDTGVDYNNPELRNKIWNNPYAKDGLLVGEHGYDFYDKDTDPMDSEGHGTHVAGIIAAEANNKSGITGAVIDKSNIKIMPLRFLGLFGGTVYDAISAYHYIYTAQRLGVNIVAVNNSWGGSIEEDDEILKTAINLVGNGPQNDGNGALSICAAGNDAINTDETINSPSGLDSKYIISVAATNEKDELVTFSNYGPNTVDIAAPGANILSTVSYNCFNPSIYEDSKRSKLCSQYESFDSGLENFKYYVTEGKVTTSSDSYFGTNGKSLKWSFDAKENGTYYLSIECNGESEMQYVSAMIKIMSTASKKGYWEIFSSINNYNSFNKDINSDNLNKLSSSNQNEEGNYWEHFFNNIDGQAKSIILLYSPYEDSNVTINIDDYAISKNNCDEEDFGTYDFYSGTSMATPYVTAAIGIASNLKNETSIERKERVLGSTRLVNSLKNKILTSGVLDYNYLTDPNPIIDNAKIDMDGKVTISIKNAKQNTQIFINNKEVEAIQKELNVYETIDKNIINTTVTITLKCGENYTISRNFFLNAGKDLNNEMSIYYFLDINNVFTDGKKTYIYSAENKTVYMLEENEGETTVVETVSLLEESIEALLGEQYQIVSKMNFEIDNTEFVVINGKIYTIFTFDFGYERNCVLAYYDTKTENYVWNKLADLPNECNVSMITLGTYNGNLYVIGGYNEYNDTVSKNVYEYNIKTDIWTKKSDLPEERFAACANQVGDKLILSFGGKNDGRTPNVLIYDGKNWKESTENIEIKDCTGIYYNRQYYKPSVGIVSGGLIYSGINAEKYGNIFCYDIDTDKFKETGYMIEDIKNSIGVSVGNKYFLFDKYASDEGISVKSMPVKTGLSKLTLRYPSTGIKAEVNAYLYSKKKSNDNTINTYYYLPGNTIDIKLSDIPGYYYTHFKVDGQEINGYKYKSTIGVNKVVKITKSENNKLIKLNKTYAEVSSFNTLKLTATVTNNSATPIKWKSSNTKYATISSTGVVTPKWEGNGKTVTIMSTTTLFGRKVSVKSKIKIKAPTIQNLRTTKTTNSSITLNWNLVNGASGYEIYKYNSITNKYQLYKRQKNNSITIYNLSKSTKYKFQVLAYKMKDNKKCSTLRASISCSTIK